MSSLPATADPVGFDAAAEAAQPGRSLTDAFAERRLIDHLTHLAWQYRSDMQFPPAEDSRKRRIEWIDEVLAKVRAR